MTSTICSLPAGSLSVLHEYYSIWIRNIDKLNIILHIYDQRGEYIFVLPFLSLKPQMKVFLKEKQYIDKLFGKYYNFNKERQGVRMMGDQSITAKGPQTRKEFLVWVKKNWKKLIAAGIGISTIIVGLKNKDSIRTLWEQLNEKIRRRNLYSTKWFQTASDEELNIEREKIRLDWCSTGNSLSEGDRLYDLLHRFDDEMIRREWEDEKPCPPKVHREHGWYLPNDD